MGLRTPTWLKKGSFATVGSKGIGKVIDDGPNATIIEYFDSISRRVQEEVDRNTIKPTVLHQHIRCYYFDSDAERWMMGRIRRYYRQERKYEVDFPDRVSAYVAEDHLFVRWNQPSESPLQILQLKGHETFFFNTERTKFLSAAIDQRRVSRGMNGLLSSNINLLQHQVEVIRRVLEDPIPRYILADEVGLGKTIESLVILRQFLLDHPSAKALIVVPSTLVKQWQEELHSRVAVEYFSDRITLVSVPDVSREHTKDHYDFVIVDEAQDIARAYVNDKRANSTFSIIQSISNGSKGLLLLSATPVLNNEQEFLAMLVLLDPERYSFDNIDAFKLRIGERQKVGRLLLGFKEDSKPFVIKLHIKQLETLFPDDGILQDLCTKLSNELKMEPNQETVNQWIREIRVHLSETYRIHRRLLRNRRETVSSLLQFGRDHENYRVPVTAEYDLDDRSEVLAELLDEWRQSAYLSEQEYWDDATVQESPLQHIYLLFVELSGTWLKLFKDALEYRLGGTASDVLLTSLSENELKLINSTPLYPDESDVLQRFLTVLSVDSEDGDRVELLKMVIDKLRSGPQKKIVVFSARTGVCECLLKELETACGVGRVVGYHRGMDQEVLESNMQTFRSTNKCEILVCDAIGEVGLNLQFATDLIHFDLPFSPNRIEQRNGRVDRIGRKSPFSFSVLAGCDADISVHSAWYDFLHRGLKVFTSSIATFQFLLQDLMPQILRGLYMEGIDGIAQWSQNIEEQLTEERTKIAEQQILDEFDAFDHDAKNFYEKLIACDSNSEEIERQVLPWIRDTLKFHVRRKMDGTISCTPNAYTLIPYDLVKQLVPIAGKPGSFSRDAALQKGDCTLYRIGEPFIDWLIRYIRWDDRGQAFAAYRYDPSWDVEEGAEWSGFVFRYVVEGDITFVTNWLRENGLSNKVNLLSVQRQLDRFFPPMYREISLDIHGSVVEDAHLLKILERPLCKVEEGGTDINLTKHRISTIDKFVPHEEWVEVCAETEKRSASHLLSDTTFVEECESRVRHCQQELDASLNQLRIRARSNHGGQSSTDFIFAQEFYARILSGVTYPKLKLDSVGFMVISGRRLLGERYE